MPTVRPAHRSCHQSAAPTRLLPSAWSFRHSPHARPGLQEGAHYTFDQRPDSALQVSPMPMNDQLEVHTTSLLLYLPWRCVASCGLLEPRVVVCGCGMRRYHLPSPPVPRSPSFPSGLVPHALVVRGLFPSIFCALTLPPAPRSHYWLGSRPCVLCVPESDRLAPPSVACGEGSAWSSVCLGSAVPLLLCLVLPSHPRCLR
jgi:hypothetical protein